MAAQSAQLGINSIVKGECEILSSVEAVKRSGYDDGNIPISYSPFCQMIKTVPFSAAVPQKYSV